MKCVVKFEEIRQKVQELFDNYDVLRNCPVDVETFIECDLEIEIVPVHGLREQAGADAMITRDFRSILVDGVYYNDERMRGRINFSLAHELGHYFLHRDYLDGKDISTEEKWFDFMNSMIDAESYRFLEFHANDFAGLLLIPHDELLKVCKNKPSIHSLTRHFQVSQSVIEHRIVALDVRRELENIYLD